MLRTGFAILMLPLLAGCAAGSGGLAVRPETMPLRPNPPATPAVVSLVERVNANAAPVSGLTASTTVSMEGRRMGGGASGQLALERPRNFKLALERGMGTPVADVGSNNDEFWIWTKDSEEKAIYVGHYGSGGTVPPDLLFQPDWIVEALGLRAIDSDEAARIKVTRGRDAGVWILTHVRDDGSGGQVVKRTVFDETTGRVMQHVFMGPDGKTPVAVVTPSQYRSLAVPRLGSTATPHQVEVPHKIHLQLISAQDPSDKLLMEIALRDVRINPNFTEVNRQALFTVPNYAGYQVMNLTPRDRTQQAASRGSSNHSRGVPPLGAEPGSNGPAPLGVDGRTLRWGDPMPIEADLGRVGGETLGASAIVRPTMPSGATGYPADSSSTDVLRAGLIR